MPTVKSYRKRVELPTALYEEVARDAKALHLGVASLVTSMVARQLETDRANASIPFRDRRPAADPHGLAVSQEIERELAATREARRVSGAASSSSAAVNE